MTIPVILSIDNNVVMPCGVTITSLLHNAKPDTFYDIYILFKTESLSEDSRERIHNAFQDKDNCSIQFVEVGERLDQVQTSGNSHITSATYYRLSIPDLFPQFNKVVYSDIDIIFQQDLSDVFSQTLLNDEWIAAVPDLSIDGKRILDSQLPSKVGKNADDYVNAGFLIMNLEALRTHNVTSLFYDHAQKKYDQHDQDILNIVCDGHIQILPSCFNFQPNHFLHYMWSGLDKGISFRSFFQNATVHYTWKHKPWNALECVAGDTWWHYYKLSPFYGDSFYFKRQQEQIEAIRNDYHNRTNKQLLLRILSNIKHKFFK